MHKYSEDYPHTSAIIEFFYRPNSKKKRIDFNLKNEIIYIKITRMYFVPLK